VLAAVEASLCGTRVRDLQRANQLTPEHVRFRQLEDRNTPSRVFKGAKRSTRTLKELSISSGPVGKIGRHFVAELLPSAEDLPDHAVVRLRACVCLSARVRVCWCWCWCWCWPAGAGAGAGSDRIPYAC
jgi:hypothetical protein